MRALFGTATTARFQRKRYHHIDRGLVRPAVRAYARCQGITYEDAHQILREADSGVPRLSPNRWQDADYCRHQRGACVVQYGRYGAVA